MTAQNASGVGDWQDPEATWDDNAYYADEPQYAAPARQSLFQRVWSGRPMIYILAAGLIGVTALVIVTRPAAEPEAAPAPARVTAPAQITYDAGPVIDNELNKP